MARRSVKKTEPTVHSSRPIVHPRGSNIDYVVLTRTRISEKDRVPQKVQDELMENARVKRARRKERRQRDDG